MSKIYKARPMKETSAFNSQVDIIVPYWGQYEKVMQLIESIFRLTRSNYYRLCVVDDASPNAGFIETIRSNAAKNANRLRQNNVLIAIRNEEQRGFGGACRAGYEATESPFVCFINSDCLIEDSGWLKKMGESLLKLKDQGVRMISPMTDNPVGGADAQKGEKFSRSEEDVVLTDDAHLSLYCFMCHRQLFPKIGGGLKEYPYGGYEDEEIAYRMKKHGFKQAVCKSSWVHHEGSATFRNLLRANPNLQDVIENENRARCIEDMKKPS